MKSILWHLIQARETEKEARVRDDEESSFDNLSFSLI